MTEATPTEEEQKEALEQAMAAAASKLRRAVQKQLGELTAEQRSALAARRQLAEPEGEGQAALLLVDDFGGAPQSADEINKWLEAGIAPPTPMTSYLRLGAVPVSLRVLHTMYGEAVQQGLPVDPSMFPAWSGDDLAVRVLGFSDDGMRRCSEAMAEAESEGDPGETPDFAQNYHVPLEREAFSNELHTIGGWREHTDGNRITTTRGDKVEVIGGNYKMLVLCRDVLGHSEAGHDSSGGHVSGATGARGARSRKRETIGTDAPIEHAGAEVGVAWERRSNGVWRSVETVSKGDSKLLQFGDSDETGFGHYALSTSGSDDPHPWHEPEDCTEDADKCQVNPKIVSKTWAQLFESRTGSQAWPIPRIASVSHVKTMATQQFSVSIDDTTEVGAMSSTTSASVEMADTTTTHEMKTRTTVDGVMMDTTVCKEMRMTVIGSTLDISVANMVSLTAGTSENLNIGGSNSFLLGAKTDTSVGPRVSVSVGGTVDLMIGAKASSTVGVEVELAGFRARAGVAADAENGLAHIYKAFLIKIG